MPSTNIKMLQIVATGLEELVDEVVFVGGAVAELYADDPELSDIRPTKDIDCVIELGSRNEHAKLEAILRKKGFAHDTSKGAPICRMIYKDIKVDVMPTDEDILGFSNKWYENGIKNRITKTLPDETEVFVFPPAYYLAAKFEAHKSRGSNDLRQSHDFEDIIYIMDNCPDILNNINDSSPGVKIYLKEECQNLLENQNITEGVESVLPYGSGEEGADIIMVLIQNIADTE